MEVLMKWITKSLLVLSLIALVAYAAPGTGRLDDPEKGKLSMALIRADVDNLPPMYAKHLRPVYPKYAQ
jgi:hypothetical protein